MVKPKLWTKEYIIITLIQFLIVLNYYVLMIITAEYAINKFRSLTGEAGFAASIFIIGALVARIFAGKWIMRLGAKKMLCAGILACFMMSLAYFGASSIILLFTIRFIHGLTFGFITTATATAVADLIPRERRGEGIAFFSLSQTLAIAIGPFLGMLLSRHGSYSTVFATAAAAAAISLIMAQFLALRQVEVTEVAQKEAPGFKLGTLFEAAVIPISVICLLVFLGYSSIFSFLTVFAQETSLVDAAGYFFSVYAAAVLISRPVVGRLFDLKGENLIMYPAIAIFAAGIFLHGHSYNGLALLAAAALTGLGFGAIQSSTHTIAVKVTARHRLGPANSTYLMFYDIGMGIGPLFAGLIIPLIGYRGMYTVMSAIALSCMVFYYFLHGKKVSPGAFQKSMDHS